MSSHITAIQHTHRRYYIIRCSNFSAMRYFELTVALLLLLLLLLLLSLLLLLFCFQLQSKSTDEEEEEEEVNQFDSMIEFMLYLLYVLQWHIRGVVSLIVSHPNCCQIFLSFETAKKMKATHGIVFCYCTSRSLVVVFKQLVERLYM